jgi:hypothetical protein
VRNHLV